MSMHPSPIIFFLSTLLASIVVLISIISILVIQVILSIQPRHDLHLDGFAQQNRKRPGGVPGGRPPSSEVPNVSPRGLAFGSAKYKPPRCQI